MHPRGVHGSGVVISSRTLSTSRPRLVGCRPSASLSGSIRSMIASWSRCFGNGSCTIYPVHAGSAFNRSIASSTSSWVAVSGSSTWMDSIPTSAQSRCLPPTYSFDAGSSPTSTVASPGVTPRARRAATRSRSSSLICAAAAFPSRRIAVMRTPDLCTAGSVQQEPRCGRGALRCPGSA